MIRKIGISIIGLMLTIGGILFMPLGPENAQAETWTETTTDDFLAGESAFIEIDDGSIELAKGLNRIWYSLGEAENDHLGRSVKGAGDVNGDGYDDIIAGADGNDGAGSAAGKAYVHFGSADGPSDVPDWSDQGEAAGDLFGFSVAGAGDVNGDGYDDIIVGARYNDSGGNNAGKAYIYYGSSIGPDLSPNWYDEGKAANDEFGRSVACAGDVNGDGYDDIIIGASGNDSAGIDAGAAFLYFGSSSGPGAAPDWLDLGRAAYDHFGFSVAGAGDVNDDGFDDIIVGAYGNDSSGSEAGAAYIYLGSPGGPGATPDWSAQGEAVADYFGSAVAGAGDVNGDGYDDIAVGAYGNDGAGGEAGEAYVYFGSISGLGAIPDWSAQGEAVSDYFGCSVTGTGDVNADGYDDLMVGAYGNDDAGSNAGKAYVYFGSAHGPSATPDWSEQGEATGDYFGFSVAGAGDVNDNGYSDILVGAYLNDDLASNAGKSYLYGSPADDIFELWRATGETSLDYYGGSTASAGDVNGDGYDDIIVGAYLNDGAGNNAGEVYVYFGSESGPSTTPDWSDQGEAANDSFGYRVACAGDVNGDGYDDIIVGAYLNDGAGADAGEVYVYYGSPTGPGAAPNWSDEGSAAGDYFGFSVAGAGDVNSDGYDEIIIGAYRNDTTGINAGKVYVYFGSASGLSASPGWVRFGEDAGDEYGYSVAGAGKVNNDEYDDIIVSAPSNSDAGVYAGKVYYYRGHSGGISTVPSWTATGENATDLMGISIAGAGDINGDEYDDIIIGAPLNDDGEVDAGKVYVYYGGGTGPGSTPAWSYLGEGFEDYLGYSVDGVGDINGDGYDDIIAGAYENDDSNYRSGKVYVHYGSADGLNSTPSWSKSGEAIINRFGFSVSGAGDTNRDGNDDIIVGALGNSDNGDLAGKAYLFSTAQYAERGRFISGTFSVEKNDDFQWLSIDWLPFTQPEDTNVKFQIATNNDGASWNFVGPDGTEDTFFTNPHGQKVPVSELGRFIKVRIYLSSYIGSLTPTVTEFSVNYAQLKEPTVIVTSPNGGEDWMKDDYYPITWNAQGDFNSTPVNLYYSTDNGENWASIVNWTENYGIYNWTVPNIETSDALIAVMVTDIYGNQAVDTSDASFAIDPPPSQILSIDSPNSNTIWGAGEHPIQWTLGNTVSSIGLELSLNGQTWEGIAEDLPNTGSYSWDIEEGMNSDTARIRLKAQEQTGPVTLSSDVFIIDTESPAIIHEEIKEGNADSPLYFHASVSDNFDVSGVTLYYNDGTGFRPISMSHENGGYGAQVTPNREGNIEYYITAYDGVNYASTDRYQLEVQPSDLSGKETKDQLDGGINIWYVGAGIVTGVAVGIILGVFISRRKFKNKNSKEQ